MKSLFLLCLLLVLATVSPAAFRGTGTEYFKYSGTGPCVVNGGAEFGISVWFRMDQTLSVDATIMGFGSSASDNPFFYLRIISSTGYLQLGSRTSAGGASSMQSVSTNYKDDAWHHLLVWRSGSTINTKVDGSLKSSVAFTLNETFDRFSIGNLVRTTDGTTVIFKGQIAEVTLLSSAPTTQEQARLYTIGLAKLRNEGRLMVNSGGHGRSYYELSADALDDGSGGYNLTEVASPAYTSTGEPWVERNSFGSSTATLNDLTPLKLVAADLSDATTYQTVVTLPASGQVAIGAAVLKSGGEDAAVKMSFKRVLTDVEAGGTDIPTMDSDGLENNTSSYVEQGAHFECRAAGDYVVEVNSAVALKGLIVHYSTNIVEGRGFVHSKPLSVYAHGHTWSVARQMYSYSDTWLIRDGVPITKLFSTPADRTTPSTPDYNDVYHQVASIVATTSGLWVMDVSHHKRILGRYIPVVAGVAGTPGAVQGVSGTSSTHTYLTATAMDDDSVIVMTRGASTGADVLSGTVYRITGVTGTISVTEDVVLGPATRNYPRDIHHVHDASNNELVVMLWQRRDGTDNWQDVVCTIWDPANSKYWNLDKSLGSGTSNGTLASPRFTTTQTNNLVSAGGIKLMNNTGGQFYAIQGMLVSAAEWVSGSKMKLLLGYGYSNGAELAYNSSVLYFAIHDGATRYVSGTNFTAPTLSSNSYRYTGDFAWEANGTSALLLVSDRGTRLTGNTYDATYEFYNDMQGGLTLRTYRITNPFSSGSIAFTEVDSITEGSSGLPMLEVNRVWGTTAPQFRYFRSANELATHRQTMLTNYSYSDPVSSTSGAWWWGF